MIHLSVSQSFGQFKRGDIIIDKQKIAEIWGGPHRHSCVRVISKPTHLSGDFFRSDAEIAERKAPKPVLQVGDHEDHEER